jgi:hypothetical protein
VLLQRKQSATADKIKMGQSRTAKRREQRKAKKEADQANPPSTAEVR